MDVKHRKTYARIKQTGIGKPIELDQGMSILTLMPEIIRQLAAMPNRYTEITITLGFEPLDRVLTSNEVYLKEMYAGLDMSLVEQATPEEEELIAASMNGPMYRTSPIYDPLYEEYVKCASPAHLATKTPQDRALLRKHMDDNYRDSEWWSGAHKW